MKKILILIAFCFSTICMAFSPAYAWGYHHCNTAYGFVSPKTMAEHCAYWIRGEGKIRNGGIYLFAKNSNKQWRHVFPWADFNQPTQRYGKRVKGRKEKSCVMYGLINTNNRNYQSNLRCEGGTFY